MIHERVDVGVVGGGPAGAIVAASLAGAGRSVVVFERAPAWRWHACGVFSSPAGVAALRRVGLAEAELARVARPVSAMAVRSRAGATFRLAYGGSGVLADSAVGFDRAALDELLLDRATAAGASIRRGVGIAAVALEERGSASLRTVSGDVVRATMVIGADGLRSIVANAAGVRRRPSIAPRAALTFHIEDTDEARDARMVVIEDGYVGIAPVPGSRLNIGIVLGRSWLGRLRREGAWPVASGIFETVGIDRAVEPLDRVAGITPVAHAVRRRAGRNWLLVGDAAGFLDPFTGEGLHRAIVSAEMAATVVDDVLAGRPGSSPASYEHAMRERFGTKDLVSRVVQGFLGRPQLFEYVARRLGTRERVRETMGLVIGDLVPASRALDPRYLISLLAP